MKIYGFILLTAVIGTLCSVNSFADKNKIIHKSIGSLFIGDDEYLVADSFDKPKILANSPLAVLIFKIQKNASDPIANENHNLSISITDRETGKPLTTPDGMVITQERLESAMRALVNNPNIKLKIKPEAVKKPNRLGISIIEQEEANKKKAATDPSFHYTSNRYISVNDLMVERKDGTTVSPFEELKLIDALKTAQKAVDNAATAEEKVLDALAQFDAQKTALEARKQSTSDLDIQIESKKLDKDKAELTFELRNLEEEKARDAAFPLSGAQADTEVKVKAAQSQ